MALRKEEISYAEMVERLAKDGGQIREELTPDDCHVLHMCMGLAGEVGELVDAVKKSVFYRKPIDVKHLMEEMGDIEFYMEGLRQRYRINRDRVIEANMEKLGERYSGYAYTDRKAIDRVDKGKE